MTLPPPAGRNEFFPIYTGFHDGRIAGGFTTAGRGRIVKETFSFPDGRRFHFADPNGNELAVWSE